MSQVNVSESGRKGDAGASQASQPAASLRVKNAAASVQESNGTNYLPLKRQVNIIPELQGLDKALIEGEDVEELIDVQAVLLLLSCMNADHKLQVQDRQPEI